MSIPRRRRKVELRQHGKGVEIHRINMTAINQLAKCSLTPLILARIAPILAHTQAFQSTMVFGKLSLRVPLANPEDREPTPAVLLSLRSNFVTLQIDFDFY